jgi:hypothetical protein
MVGRTVTVSVGRSTGTVLTIAAVVGVGSVVEQAARKNSNSCTNNPRFTIITPLRNIPNLNNQIHYT